MKKWVILVVGLLIVAGVIKLYPRHLADTAVIHANEVKIGDTTIHVDIANTPALQEQGLSGRASLADGSGMLFVFETPAVYGFWMKDMNFPLDIIWLDSEKRVTSIDRDISPSTYPQVFRPSVAIKYVLEVPANFAQRHGVDIGNEVFFGL